MEELLKKNQDNKLKILFLCKKGIYGSSYGLINSCTFISDKLNELGIKSKVVMVVDNNDIDREVAQYKPCIVIIEALWVVPSKFKTLMQLYPNITWVVRIHSNVGFLVVEGQAFQWINEYLDYHSNKLLVATNNYQFFKHFHKKGMIYLPNIYKEAFSYSHHDKNAKEINVGCFGSLRALKNQNFQALCAIKFADGVGKKLIFHINYIIDEEQGNTINKNLIHMFNGTNHQLKMHDWKTHTNFIELVKKMDIGMQLSFTESFNLVTADFIANGIPIVVSEAIDWAPPYLKTSNVDFEKVIKKLRKIYCSRNSKLFQKRNYKFLEQHNTGSLKVWTSFVKGECK